MAVGPPLEEARAARPAPSGGGGNESMHSGGGARHRRVSSLGSINSVSESSTFAEEFCSDHFALAYSGQLKLQIEYSPWVCGSSLLYLAVALTYVRTGLLRWAAWFLLQTFFSLQADSLNVRSPFFNAGDRLIATIGTCLMPVRIVVWEDAPTWQNRLYVFALTVFALSFLGWSRRSTKQAEYELRHTVWHVASSLCLCWFAARDSADGFAAPHTPLERAFYTG